MSRSLPCLVATAVLLVGAPAAHATGLTGAFQCQSMLGEAGLEFVTADRLRFDGEELPYQVACDRIVVLQYGQARPHPFSLRGDVLQLTSPEGITLVCNRVGGRAGATAGVGDGRPGDGAAGGASSTAANAQLAGMLCGSAGSSGTGGSNQRNVRVSFDGRGRFTTGGDSSFSGPAGFGYGEAATEGGRYEVSAAVPGATIRVQWDNGEADEAQVHHVVDGRITEIMYGRQLLGAGLCAY